MFTSTDVKDVDQLLSLGDEEFVQSCYRGLLFREPDPIGFSQYLAKVIAGEDRLAIAAGIASSAEARLLHFSKKKLIGAVLARHAASLIQRARSRDRRAKAARRISDYMNVLSGGAIDEPLSHLDPFEHYLENVIGPSGLGSTNNAR